VLEDDPPISGLTQCTPPRGRPSSSADLIIKLQFLASFKTANPHNRYDGWIPRPVIAVASLWLV